MHPFPCDDIHDRLRVNSWGPRKNFMGEDIYMVARTPGKIFDADEDPDIASLV